MKRFLFLLVLVAVATVFLAERYVWLRDAMPWLPHLPWAKTETASTAADGAAPGQGAGRHRSGGAAGSSAGGGGRRGGFGGPTPVLVAQARYTDLPVTTDILGTVQATNTVTVKTQVDGKLIEVDFQEGQDVKKGDILARIDPATYQASYDQAVAKKAQDDSILANAQVDLIRYQKLAETQYGSHQQADTQKALVTQTQAIVQQDQAAIDSAKTTLNYATVRSPIDGRTGIRLVDQGNIVHASDTTGIVTVAQVRPISIIVNLPQQYLASVNASNARGSLKAEARDGDNRKVIDTGVLQVIDNTIDQTTGTVKLKASFPNDKLQLWPGQFVNVRLYIDMLSHVVVVPTSAVQRGPDGSFVYVVGDAETVKMQPVTVGRQTETDSVVTAGLEVPATVVTTGFTRLTDGSKVTISTATASAGASDAPVGGGEAVPSGKQGETARPDAAGQPMIPTSATGAAPASGHTGDGPAETPAASATPNDTPPEADQTRHRHRDGRKPRDVNQSPSNPGPTAN
ncbi:efflux RND transporter periplasmic adaptor subunit [Lichenihabitans sp. PAMC28606]|uniref:efflux RND transporter periplasmic adaptor subunit n=1 Tax=Lichenihabitans sp. PAMC28606 TaxID=2880932 RepID=UPI001D09C6ED|nr:efflux RND transporter periplasmic adaptor subunit [Lichenihabitans sp. PAMC28606]UDL94536.1 efflux RND transporter periplasmic adaptor subunit [Lichenihabitans sp. PAMC28606]